MCGGWGQRGVEGMGVTPIEHAIAIIICVGIITDAIAIGVGGLCFIPREVIPGIINTVSVIVFIYNICHAIIIQIRQRI